MEGGGEREGKRGRRREGERGSGGEERERRGRGGGEEEGKGGEESDRRGGKLTWERGNERKKCAGERGCSLIYLMLLQYSSPTMTAAPKNKKRKVKPTASPAWPL